MNVGKIIRPRQTQLGTALAVAGKPALPQRPQMHRNKPPTMDYRRNHPTLTSPAQPAALPVRATQGVNSNQLNAYVKALQSGRQ
jgi:hypothetical protein